MVDTATIEDQAIAWSLRAPGMTGREWEEFVAWLEGAPEHRDAWRQVAEAEAGLVAAAPSLVLADAMPAAAPTGNRRFGWRSWQGGASVAAAIALALLAGWNLWPDAPLRIEHTEPGITKQIAFADGTRIDLNGDTTLALDQSDPRRVRLDHGEALFHVRHKPQSFTVDAGGFVVRDLGTVFNVELTTTTLKLDVSEGSVLFDPEGTAITVAAGRGLTVDRARNLVVERGSAGAGGWAGGEMRFDNARLDDVITALHRRYGIAIILSAGLSGRPFTGNVRFAGDEANDVAHFAGLIGARVRREGQTWILEPATAG